MFALRMSPGTYRPLHGTRPCNQDSFRFALLLACSPDRWGSSLASPFAPVELATSTALRHLMTRFLASLFKMRAAAMASRYRPSLESCCTAQVLYFDGATVPPVQTFAHEHCA